jgi:hypothetical protein
VVISHSDIISKYVLVLQFLNLPTKRGKLVMEISATCLIFCLFRHLFALKIAVKIITTADLVQAK